MSDEIAYQPLGKLTPGRKLALMALAEGHKTCWDVSVFAQPHAGALGIRIRYRNEWAHPHLRWLVANGLARKTGANTGGQAQHAITPLGRNVLAASQEQPQ